MISKDQPWEISGNETLEDLFYKIKIEPLQFRHKVWNKVSEDVKDLIKKMLNKIPEKRITINDALKHPALNKENKMKDLINDITLANLKS